MLPAVRAAYAEHLELLRESEVLRLEQARLLLGSGGGAKSTAGDHPHDNKAAESELERAAAAAHGDSYLTRLLSMAKGWEWRDVELLTTEFQVSPRRLIVAASAASGAVIALAFVKARATGALFDVLSRATSGAAVEDLARLALPLLLVVLLCAAGEWAANVARDFLFARARAQRIVAVRVRYLAAMLSQDATFHDAHRSGELALRLNADPDALDDAVLHTLERLLQGCLALCAGAYILWVDWRTLAFGLALRLPFALQFVEASVQTTTAYERLETAAAAAAGARAAECLGAVRALQANTAEDSEVAGYARLLGRQARVRRAAAGAVSLLRHTERIVVALSDAAMLGLGGYRILRGGFSLGTFTALQSVMGIVVSEFNMLEAAYVGLRQAALRSRRYVALRDRVPAVRLHIDLARAEAAAAAAELWGTSDAHLTRGTQPERGGALVAAAVADTAGSRAAVAAGAAAPAAPAPAPAADPAAGATLRRRPQRRQSAVNSAAVPRAASSSTPSASPAVIGLGLSTLSASPATLAPGQQGQLRGAVLCFDDVTFAYTPSSPAVLRHISFTAAPGRVVALVGPSGSGKSTVARLAMRFFDVTAGRVKLDGVDVRELDAAALRRRVAVVDQDPALLDRSVYDNITLGCDVRPPLAAVRAAASLAHIDDFITSLPLGYDTNVGERGGRLSGGQAQRVRIARAILRDPAVLILDEATAALDAASEAAVTAALENLMRGRTTVVIAHRLSTVRRADEILVLHGGAIVERGGHDDLLREHPAGLYASLLQHQTG